MFKPLTLNNYFKLFTSKSCWLAPKLRIFLVNNSFDREALLSICVKTKLRIKSQTKHDCILPLREKLQVVSFKCTFLKHKQTHVDLIKLHYWNILRNGRLRLLNLLTSCWKSEFSLGRDFSMGGYQRLFITVSTMQHLLKSW